VFANSDAARAADLAGAQAVKLLIAGGFGAGKTTLVGAVSEIRPLRTEERLSEIGAAVDDLTGVAGKTTTTVALDFGRITINPEVVLYLFGTPGQDRFWFPFIVAVNCFDGADVYEEDEVRQALDIGAHVPVQLCDARDRGSSKQVLVRLLEYLMATATALLDNRYR